MIFILLALIASFLLGVLTAMAGFARIIKEDVRLSKAWSEYAERKELRGKNPNR